MREAFVDRSKRTLQTKRRGEIPLPDPIMRHACKFQQFQNN